NLFIGEPNTGKSNILEALALLSWCGHPADEPLQEYVRFHTMPNLFYDQLLDQEIAVTASLSDQSRPRLHVAVDFPGIRFNDAFRKCCLQKGVYITPEHRQFIGPYAPLDIEKRFYT
ncbi:hypothetical protein, partial [Pelotomaculum sp. PtaB.Bin117]|uniref:hypothetical protein n=1 Tax=Pelotomaculum sp. PtaB.Bin117 TaxID=1811694 RepID=UPI00257CC3C9